MALPFQDTFRHNMYACMRTVNQFNHSNTKINNFGFVSSRRWCLFIAGLLLQSGTGMPNAVQITACPISLPTHATSGYLLHAGDPLGPSRHDPRSLLIGAQLVSLPRSGQPRHRRRLLLRGGTNYQEEVGGFFPRARDTDTTCGIKRLRFLKFASCS